MVDLLKQLWSLFNRRERWQIAILLVALIARAGVAMVGVASVMPFMSVVADPEIIQRNQYLSRAYDVLGFTSTTGFLTALGVTVVVLLAVSNGVSGLAVYGLLRFSWGMQHRVCVRIFEHYLRQPYAFFVQRNSAGLNKTLLTEVQSVMNGVLKPSLDIAARLLTICALISLLLFVDPLLALAVAVLLGGVYGAIYMVVKTKQRRLGKAKVRANRERFKISGEAFGGIKDVKVLQREREFVERFQPASWRYSKAVASNAIMAQMPRYFIETIAFGGIVLIVLYYLQLEQDVRQILPMISLYAVAGYRLMPELQTLFGDVATIRFNRAALDDLLEDYRGWSETTGAGMPQPLPFERSITVESVTFEYPGAAEPALDAVSLRIERNRTVGLVGSSGAGKTTLVDLLLGLYLPDSGRILIDDAPLEEHTLATWRRHVGYVPQHIFLTDDSIAANIAFGLPAREIDLNAVERAARIANLHDFITSMPAGYDTIAGERGVRLSGGQRQRIGIARALYHDPAVLVMDEATSALDGATETAVMEAIRELAGRKTIILIAHRLSTVKDCDLIYLLERGRVRDQGTYAELSAGSVAFRSMAGLDAAVPL